MLGPARGGDMGGGDLADTAQPDDAVAATLRHIRAGRLLDVGQAPPFAVLTQMGGRRA
jgi:hypothetical protein